MLNEPLIEIELWQQLLTYDDSLVGNTLYSLKSNTCAWDHLMLVHRSIIHSMWRFADFHKDDCPFLNLSFKLQGYFCVVIWEFICGRLESINTGIRVWTSSYLASQGNLDQCFCASQFEVCLCHALSVIEVYSI